ncbi:MAG TPA: exonuclease domain-containing protein [Candidatus Peribacterales bacterium]|nr:exonuclease domain-containing protein [Candidatus Peribacterales bacterium]
MPFPHFPFVVLDTETTGLIPRSDRIIELALLRFEDGEKVAEYEGLYSVPTAISPVARALTRISPEDLSGKPAFESEKVKKLIDGAVIIGQNILFDLGMLKGEGMELDGHPWIDSAILASIVFPEAKSYSLGYLSEFLGLPHEPKHRAMGDVIATTALLEKVWARMQELPHETIQTIKSFAERGPEGYAAWCAEMTGNGKTPPEWLSSYTPRNNGKKKDAPVLSVCGSSKYVHSKGKKTWLAVKNLDAFLSENDSGEFTPVFAPPFLLNPESRDAFLTQSTFTADELTLAIKLHLYSPIHHRDFPLHGTERDVWNGKLACTKESVAYGEQFKAAENILLDHRQLFELLLHAHTHAPEKGEFIIIDDASMLEDTATKALKWSCSTDPLRAAAVQHGELTSFLDAYQMWLEHVRNFQEVRYLVSADLTSKEARGLNERLEQLIGTLQTAPLQELAMEQLGDLQKILNPKNLQGRIAFIEQYRDGGQILQSAPLDLAEQLRALLYARCDTLLILPPGERAEFAPIIPVDAEGEIITEKLPAKPPLRYASAEFTIERLLPRTDGRVICLVSSKRTIEELYVKNVEALEVLGIGLIAQGLSGGQGRMQAEFQTAGERVVWMMTPWMYEGIELPPEFVDHLWIHSLPFDHPSNAILSARSEHYGSKAFDLYFVPRLLQRLFRLFRTYSKHRKADGDILILDQRLQTKSYGKRVMEYMNVLCS